MSTPPPDGMLELDPHALVGKRGLRRDYRQPRRVDVAAGLPGR